MVHPILKAAQRLAEQLERHEIEHNIIVPFCYVHDAIIIFDFLLELVNKSIDKWVQKTLMRLLCWSENARRMARF